MSKIIAAVCAGALIFAGAASAATPAQKIASLQKNVKVLKKNVKVLQKSVKTLKTTVTKQQKTINDLNTGLGANLAVSFCLLGATADALQSTWTTFDQSSGSSVFGTQQTISDGNACSALQIARQGIRTPPTVSVFSALVALLGSSKTSAFSAFDPMR